MKVNASSKGRPGTSTDLVIGAVWAVALLTVAWTIVAAGLPERWLAVCVLGALGLLSKGIPKRFVRSGITLTLSSIVLLTAIPLVGPAGAALVGAVSVVGQIGRTRRQALVFNMAMHAIMGGLSGLAYLWAGGAPGPLQNINPMSLLLDVGLPLLIADLVQCLINAVLLALILRVSTGTPFGAQVRFLVGSTGAGYIGYGLLSFLLFVLWVPAGVGPFGTVLILAPLLVARWALGQYSEEMQAHNRTLTALVAAIEIKSPSLTGHSAAVATVSGWIGDELHLPSADVEAAETAGMLHDIGLLGLPSELLRPDHVLTPAEADLLKEHSGAAARMLAGISFLDRAVVGVVNHHERFDGTGYPAGLLAEGIPLIGRVVAVADGFVALLSPRLDRPAFTTAQALEVMQALGRSAYDPVVVSALARAMSRHEAPSLPDAGSPAVVGSAVAHDEPVPFTTWGVSREVEPAPTDVVHQ